jgi:hypothetical protein
VKFSHGDKIGAEGSFTDYNDEDADYNVFELSAISDAMFRYFDQRIFHKWTQTAKELIVHAMAHDAIAKDAAIMKMVADRVACVAKDEQGKPIYQCDG